MYNRNYMLSEIKSDNRVSFRMKNVLYLLSVLKSLIFYNHQMLLIDQLNVSLTCYDKIFKDILIFNIIENHLKKKEINIEE
jgi:hypothetical protein